MRFNFGYVVINLLIIKEKEWILTVKPKLCQNIFVDKSAEWAKIVIDWFQKVIWMSCDLHFVRWQSLSSYIIYSYLNI